MKIENREFKGVWIPKEVWLDIRLSAIEKTILVEIDSLDSTEKGCWASNKHFAEFCQCSERTVSAAISKLIKLEYINVQSFDGRQRELKSKYTMQDSIESIAKQTRKNCEADTQNLRENNTTNNTTNISINNREKRFIPPTLEEVKAYCQERKNNIDPEAFINFYESKGWYVGKNKMKNWQAAVRNWEKNSKEKATFKNSPPNYDVDALRRKAQEPIVYTPKNKKP